MKDRIITLICLLAVLLSFGVVVSWARSTMNCEGISIGHRYGRYFLQANEGTFRVMRSQLMFADTEAESAWRAVVDPDHTRNWDAWNVNWSRDMRMIGSPDQTFFGFGGESAVVDASRRIYIPGVQWRQTIVQIPHWFVILLIGGLPSWWLLRRHRVQRDRARLGLCRRCGFEMGSLYHSCPKCGERAPLPEGFPVIQPH